jgi:outer membrane protein assembly factor BamA
MKKRFPSLRMRLLPASLLFVLALGDLAVSPINAQPQPTNSQTAHPAPTSTYKLLEIKVNGSKRFTPEEVATACGLPPGAVVGDEDFKKAARQLGESGAFHDIAYTYSYSSAGLKLTFQVSDADKFVPAHFTDFVWFGDHDLLQKVHERVPLFNGELPATGRLPDQVSDVLQALLLENGVPGHVEYQRTNGKSEHLESFDYNVSGVTIRVHKVEFPGSTAEELPELKEAAEKLSGRAYSRTLLTSFAEHTVLPVYRERGYLRASCALPEPKVVKPADSESTESGDYKHEITFVDVSLPITPGSRYKLSGWNWVDNKEIASDTLQPLLHAKIGQPADTVQLDADLRAVQELYGSRGFVTATIKAVAEFDDTAGTVQYHLEVTEGALYHMGELAFRGIDNNLEARLRAAWKIRPGDVYDATYLKQYLPQARKLLPTSVDWEVSTHVTALTRDKTIDVDLQYMAKAPK